MIDSRRDSRALGRQLAARAWSPGLFAAARKACVGDGGSWLWAVRERRFKGFGFVPILDFIHALTHMNAAALAGFDAATGWEIDRRWIAWVRGAKCRE